MLVLTALLGLAAADPVPAGPPGDRTVLLGSGLTDEQVIQLTSAAAASGRDPVVLLDTPKARPHLKRFLDAFNPTDVWLVGSPSENVADVEQRLGRRVGATFHWARGPPESLWRALLPGADRVVVCPAEPRSRLLHAALQAGACRAPLLVRHGEPGEDEALARWR